MDPAFDAHVLPVKFWSLAVWESWIDANKMTATIANVRDKLSRAKCAWSVTTGPVAALLNSLQRVGWTLESHTILRDDRMRKFDLYLDPPTVVCVTLLKPPSDDGA